MLEVLVKKLSILIPVTRGDTRLFYGEEIVLEFVPLAYDTTYVLDHSWMCGDVLIDIFVLFLFRKSQQMFHLLLCKHIYEMIPIRITFSESPMIYVHKDRQYQ